jgi:hypothetical protein
MLHGSIETALRGLAVVLWCCGIDAPGGRSGRDRLVQISPTQSSSALVDDPSLSPTYYSKLGLQ